MDLIDRKSLLIQIEISPQNAFIRNTPLAMDLRKLYSNVIKLAPTVDAVEVVRCKDCQYSHELSVFVKGLVECEKSCSGECLKREDWYCPLGERRGD